MSLIAGMEPLLLGRLILLMGLLGLSAFFSGSEVALFSLTRIQVDRLKARNPQAGVRVERLLAKPQRLLVTIFIGNELTNVAISAVVTVIALELFGSAGLAVAMGVASFLLLVVGEITPKTLAHYHNQTWAALASGPLLLFMGIIWPLRELVTFVAGRIVRLFGGATDIERVITEDELLTLVEEGADEGVIDQDEKEMIQSVFDLGDMSLYEVMTPRTDIVAIDVDTPLAQAWKELAASPYARAPIYRESIDDIVGVLFKKDLLKLAYPPPAGVTLASLAREPFIVPETMTVNELLREFKRKKTHMAVAMDEYGGVAGLVTLDDIISELVLAGATGSGGDDEVRPDGEGRWRVPASMDLADFDDRFGGGLDHEEIETVGGLVFHRLGRPPAVGDEVAAGRLVIRVEGVSGRRITDLLVIDRPAEESPEAKGEGR
ncbi:MAG: HlyC/CorC family transporter [Nitrospinae bacterium]|nr:HlyC/CorC family transporter [Nitrospinota bacterium]